MQKGLKNANIQQTRAPFDPNIILLKQIELETILKSEIIERENLEKKLKEILQKISNLEKNSLIVEDF